MFLILICYYSCFFFTTENLKNSVLLRVLCGELKIYSSLKASAGSTFDALDTGMAVPIREMTRSSK